MKTLNEKAVGATSLLSGAFVVSTFGVWTRFVAPMFSAAAQITGRCLLAAVLLAGIVAINRKKHIVFRGYTKQQYFGVVVLGVLTSALALLFTFSVTTTKVGNTSSLIYAGSILTSFFVGVFLLREKTSVLKVGAVLMALGGLAMYGSGLLGLSIGIVAGLGAGICDGASNVVRRQLRGVDRNMVIICQYAIAGICTVPMLFVGSGDAIKTVSIGAIVAMVMFTLASLAFSGLLLRGFSNFDVNAGGVILAMQIFFGMLLGYLLFHEVPTGNELFGSMLIFLAVVVAMSSESKIFSRIRKKQMNVAVAKATDSV
jgi:drug/metabolite transporter (DMT)-like permease